MVECRESLNADDELLKLLRALSSSWLSPCHPPLPLTLSLWQADSAQEESDGGAPSFGAGGVANLPQSAVSGVPHAHGAPHGAPPKPPSRISHSSASCPAASSSKPLPPQPVQQPRSAPGGGLERKGNGETRAGEGAGHSAAPIAETAVATKLPAKAQTKYTVDKAPPTGQEKNMDKEKEREKGKETKRESETESSVVAREKRHTGCEKGARGAAAAETHQAKIKVEGQELGPTPTGTTQKAAPGVGESLASESLHQHCVTLGPSAVSSETSESSPPSPETASKPGVAAAGPISAESHAALGAATSPPPPPPPPPPASSASCLPVKHSDAAAALSGDGASRKATPGDHQSAAETLAALASLTKQREAGSAANHSSSQGAQPCASSKASKAPEDARAPAALSKVAVGVKQLPEVVASSQVAGSHERLAAPGGAEREHGEGVGHEYIGVEKAPGDGNEYSCRLNTALRFRSAEEAAWGHDVLCIRHGRAETLNFAGYRYVISKVLNAVQEIQEKDKT